MNRADFIERVEGYANFGPGDAEAAVVATIAALGAALTPNERRSVRPRRGRYRRAPSRHEAFL